MGVILSKKKGRFPGVEREKRRRKRKNRRENVWRGSSARSGEGRSGEAGKKMKQGNDP